MKKLRNKLAHPDLEVFSSEKQFELKESILTCLEMFYRLVLDTYKNSGPVVSFNIDGNSKVEYFGDPDKNQEKENP